MADLSVPRYNLEVASRGEDIHLALEAFVRALDGITVEDTEAVTINGKVVPAGQVETIDNVVEVAAKYQGNITYDETPTKDHKDGYSVNSGTLYTILGDLSQYKKEEPNV